MSNKTILLFLLFSTGVALSGDSSLPEWSRSAVWYQILPERFKNANPYNDPIKSRVFPDDDADWQTHPWASDWYKLQIWEEARGIGFEQLVADRRFGGDIHGIMEKIPYLSNLGIDVIYLAPIFESPSVLKYDAASFHHVDNNFGLDRSADWELHLKERDDPEAWEMSKADEVFVEMLDLAHENKLRVVIEATFAYCSDEFWAFRDVKLNQEDSKYKDWFRVLEWDNPATPDTVEFNYDVWRGNENWPLFNQESDGLVAPVKDYIFACTKRWLDPDGDGDPQDGVDGWSIRNTDQIADVFWEEWVTLVKQTNPSAITVSDSRSIDGNGVAGVFDFYRNDELRQEVYSFFIKSGGKTVSEFDENIRALHTASPGDSMARYISALSDFGRGRIATFIKNHKYPEDREPFSDSYRDYDPTRPDSTDYIIQKQMAVFQLTYPGSPAILYGDETGMWGGFHPYNNKPMLWPEFVYENETYTNILPDTNFSARVSFDADFFKLYRTLILLREDHEALRFGSFETYVADNEQKIYAYGRRQEDEEIVVVLNFDVEDRKVSLQPDWEDGIKVRDLFRDKKIRFKKESFEIEVGARGYVVLVKS